MKAVHAPLAIDERGDAVANLHAALDRLGFGGRITDEERAERRYGDGTAIAVRSLQHDLGVPTERIEAVDEPTAEAINRQLFEQGDFRLVDGQVTHPDGGLVVGNLVSAFDEENIGGAHLGVDNTNADGFYQIFYDPSLYSQPGEGVLRVKEVIDLVVQVHDDGGSTLAESEPLHDPDRHVRVDLRVGDLPRRKPFVVRGQVMDAAGPVSEVEVAAYDRDLGAERQLLGEEALPHSTDEEGRFEIAYALEKFEAGEGERLPLSKSADLIFELRRNGAVIETFQVFRVFPAAEGQPAREEVVSEDDRLLVGIPARPIEEVRIVLLDGEPRRELSEYERLWRAIEPMLPERPPEGADEVERERRVCEAAARFDEEKHRDISFVARETDWELDHVASLSSACRLTVELGHGVTSAVLYGLAQSAGLRDVRGLGSASLATLTEALQQAVANNVIGRMDEPEITAAVELIHRVAPEHALGQPLNGSAATLGGLLDLAIESTEQQTELLQFAAEHRGTPGELWQKLREHPTFAEKAVEIQYVTRLSALTQHNLPLIKKVRQELPEAHSMRHVTFVLDDAKMKEMVRAEGVTLPEGLPGEDEDERRDLYAAAMVNLMRASEPTAAAARTLRRLSAEDDQTIDPRVAAFVEKLVMDTNFDMLASRVDDYETLIGDGDDTRKIVVGQLKRAQRLLRISTGEANFARLLKTRLNSAFDITRMYTRSGFMADHQKAMGGEAEANLAYSRSLAISNAALIMALQAYQLANDARPSVVTGGLKETPSWAEMFKSVEMCDCEHCRSWYGPAAYFVDLLLFLDRRTGAAAAKTPLDVLLSRRPDLQHIKLTCENTNTPLPYIDLVNEVLESYIALGDRLDHTTAHDIDDETAAELRAMPQHVVQNAYDTLAEQFYPITLPFNRWLEMERAYLGQLGVGRHDLMAAFADSFGANEEAKQREQHSEFLGISAREHELITGKSFNLADKQEDVLKLYGIDEDHIYEPLEEGSSGASVVVLQAKLIERGATLMLDGQFGPNVAQAVEDFQGTQGLPASGKVDALTWDKLKPLPPGATALFVTHVPEFIARTRLTFLELVELLKCRFVNPNGTLYDQVEAIYATFGITSKELRTFIRANFVADPALTDRLAKHDRTPEELKATIQDGLPADQVRNLIVLYSDAGDECDPAMMLLQHLDGSPLNDVELRRLHVFVRLWRKLGWTMPELDRALLAFGPNEIAPDCLEDLARIEQLRRATDVPLVSLLSLWRDLDTHGPDSTYRRLFQNRSTFNPPDEDLKPRLEDNDLLPAEKPINDKVPAILAALRLRADDLVAIRKDAQLSGAYKKTTLANLSTLHRYALLARLLNLRVPDLVALRQLSGSDPFVDRKATLEFQDLVEAVKASGFSVAQLLYLYDEETAGPGKLAPSEAEIVTLAERMQSGLLALAREHGLPEDITPEALQSKLALVLDADRLALAAALIEGRQSEALAALKARPALLEAEKTRLEAELTAEQDRPQPDAGRMSRLNDRLAEVADDLARLPQSEEKERARLEKEFARLVTDGWVAAEEEDRLFNPRFVSGDSEETDKTRRQRMGHVYQRVAVQVIDRLSRAFVKQTLSEALQISAETTQTLLEDELVLKAMSGHDEPAIGDFLLRNGLRAEYFNNQDLQGDPPALVRVDPAIDFDWQRDKPVPALNADAFSVRWSGWIMADTSAEHTLSMRVDGGVRLWVNETLLIDQWHDAAQGEYTTKIKLEAGKLSPIKVEWLGPSSDARIELRRSRPSAPRPVVPTADLFQTRPAFFASPVEPFTRLHKIALLANTLGLTSDELRYISRNGDRFDSFDLNGFNATPFVAGFKAWLRLASYASLRNRRTSGEVQLIEVFAAADTEKIKKLAAATGWTEDVLTDGLAALGKTEADLVDEKAFASLERVVELGRTIGVMPSRLKQWTEEAPSQQQAQEVVSAVKARYDDKVWLEVAGTINDALRERQRNALVAYVLTRETIRQANVRTPNDLFDYFLIDVEMSACMLTSRIKQAISSAQLFVQRVLLNLDTEDTGLTPAAIDGEQWPWRKNYRVWEANRKIFLYPENWIEPELRDDKTPFFKELEAELLQADVNTETVERSLLTYLEKLDGVARLEICGFYWQKDGEGRIDILHVFGRTMTGVPRAYYYRRLEGGKEWTPWEPVTVDIQGVEKDENTGESGVHLVPVVWKDRLYLFWPQFTKKSGDSPLLGGTHKRDEDVTFHKLSTYWQVKLAWSRYDQSKWTPKQLSDVFMNQPAENLPIVKFTPWPEGDELHILAVAQFYVLEHISSVLVDSFTLSDPYSPARVDGDQTIVAKFLKESTIHLWKQYSQRDHQYWTTSTPFYINTGSAKAFEKTDILRASPGGRYRVLPTHQRFPSPLDSLAFYQGRYHSYFVRMQSDAYPIWTSFDKFPLVRLPDIKLRPRIDNRLDVELVWPQPPDPLMDPSPWRDASSRLLPTAIAHAAADVSLPETRAVALQALGDTSGWVPMQTLSAQPEMTALVRQMDTQVSAALLGNLFTKPKGVTTTVNVKFTPFFHPHVGVFIEGLKRHGLPGLLNLSNQTLGANDKTFEQQYRPVRERVRGDYPKHDVDFSPGGAYSIYNWELFFHVPVLLAMRLSQNQRFAEAQKWFHYVFDPTDATPDAGKDRFWKVRPLREATERLAEMFLKLKPGGNNSPEEQDVVDQLNAMVKHPFQPHRIARLRVIAYQKFVVMKYIENLVAWADQLFGRDTIESINEATQLYILAARILGARPQRIPPRRVSEPMSFFELRPLLDEASNAVVEAEDQAPFASLVASVDGQTQAALLSTGSTLYFCIPQNDKLLSYWDLVEDRLFKIRHCMNIAGVVRKLPLFEPPIDPALLVKAAAAGIDIGSVLSDLGAPLPRYRFAFSLQKALEMTAELRTLGQALLSALEKKDAEHLAMMRAQHETVILNAVRSVKEWQKAEAEAVLNAVRASRSMAVLRLQYYSRLLGENSPAIPPEPDDPSKPDESVQTGDVAGYHPTGRFQLLNGGKITVSGSAVGGAAGNQIAGPAGGAAGAAIGAAIGDLDIASLDSGTKILQYEQEELVQSFMSSAYSMASSTVDALSAVLRLVPQVKAHAAPLGVGAGFGFGGVQLGGSATAVASVLKAVSTWHGFKSSLAGRLAGFVWREQEQAFQRNMAAFEIKQIDKQIIASKIRHKIASLDLDNHDTQVDQAQKVGEFLGTKYTQQELYNWMVGAIGKIYFSAYQLAYDLAKRAERCYRFEMGTGESGFISFGYWDSLRKGLMAGEELQLALKQMERAYYDVNRREHEVTKHVSIRQLDPLALIRLAQTGRCEFDLPEALFDLDFPGHYFRRIKSVSLTVPSVTGPYTGVHCTVTQLTNRIRTNGRVGDGYAEQIEEDDPRFVRDFAVSQSIATSTGQNDSGMFELSFRDERYLPFEGAGVISTWRLELPDEFRAFDYETISDVVLTLRYTARDGGGPLKGAAIKALQKALADTENAPLMRLFSARHEFPSAWQAFLHPKSPDPQDPDKQSMQLHLGLDRFPYQFGGMSDKISVHRVEVYVQLRNEVSPSAGFDLYLSAPGGNPDPNSDKLSLQPDSNLRGFLKGGRDVQSKATGMWRLWAWKTDLAPLADHIGEVFLVFHYSVK